ncbi:hypothetical protein [Alloactinosynnema sp. L-07]|uniref:hypothetical protein n=1 Tax=Alloactinosynnema sp. L-07 TaxID=1653480 RepID=UPI0015609F83|nr:hypothetical protein [Alloactinosynnema sp. L-07]
MPPADLPTNQVHPAASIDPTLPLRADLLLDQPGAPWQPLARPLLAAVHATGHRIWLSGGASRDLASDVPLHEVNDLDLAGTVPAGRFTDITYQTMRATRMTEFRTTVTPGTLVCAVTPPWNNIRVIEYRGLSQGGFEFPLIGSRIAEDSRHRDFSFNTLLYDVLDHVVLDACGTGLVDLRAEKLRFAPRNESTDPATQAMILFRALKFAVRWHDRGPHDLAPLAAWLDGLPPDFFDPLTCDDWSGLRGAHRRSVTAPVDRQHEFADLLPEPGRSFLRTLIGRAS